MEFARNLVEDQGGELNPATVISSGTIKTSLSNLCSDEQTSRWGANSKAEGGVGLNAAFVWRSSAGERREEVNIPAWQRVDETGRPQRHALAKKTCEKLRALAGDFTKAVPRNCNFALVVDTTDGVSADLARRVHEVITDLSGQLKTCAAGSLYVYRLADTSSQGDRRKIDRGALGYEGLVQEAENWLRSQSVQAESSVLRGLRGSLTEISRLPPADLTRVHVLTDALENVGNFSVYGDRTLLNEGKWSQLDGAWDPGSLELTGPDVHLHPLPGETEDDTTLTGRAFQYLKDRLEAHGAKVTIEPL